jgi:hypothetical protein
MTVRPDPRFELACDHLQQALAILPPEGSETIRLLVTEAVRLCTEKAYDHLHELFLVPAGRSEEPPLP